MAYNIWTTEVPNEPGLYAIALNNVVIDVARFFVSDGEFGLQSIHSSEKRSVVGFITLVIRNTGWRTSFPCKQGTKMVTYDQRQYPHHPPLLWNKLDIPPLCYRHVLT